MFVFGEREDPNTIKSGANSGPPAKRHLNGQIEAKNNTLNAGLKAV